jgi:hypothetical protein
LEQQSGESFSSQLKASTAFSKRVPFTFLIHAVLILVIVIALHWMRRGIRKLAEEKPDLQRALPILDLPIFNRFRDFLRHQPIEPCRCPSTSYHNPKILRNRKRRIERRLDPTCRWSDTEAAMMRASNIYSEMAEQG